MNKVALLRPATCSPLRPAVEKTPAQISRVFIGEKKEKGTILVNYLPKNGFKNKLKIILWIPIPQAHPIRFHRN